MKSPRPVQAVLACLVLSILAVAGFPGPLLGTSDTTAEHPQDQKKHSPEHLKATLLIHFIAQSRWPEAALPKDGSREFRLGIVGKNILADQHRRYLAKISPLGSRAKISIFSVNSAEEAKGAHLLFFSAGVSADQKNAILSACQNKPVLTLGTDLTVGSMFDIHFYNQKIRFSMNSGLLRGSGIAVSKKLMVLNKPATAEGSGK